MEPRSGGTPQHSGQRHEGQPAGPHPGRSRGREPRARAWRGPGFWPGFGPGSGSWGRGARAPRGNVRTAVLALLAERPRHGYEIIREITTRSAGEWRPSPGSVYPTIAQLDGEGLVRTEQADGRRVVHLTEQGRRYADEHVEQFAALFEEVGDPAGDSLLGLRDVAGQVGIAVAQVGQAGTDRQIALASEVLAETRRRLYRILAEDS